MKKLLALLLAICLVLGLTAAFAEEDEDLVTYTMEHPEAKVFCSTWVADNGDRRIEVYDEDGGLKLYIVHKLGDNKEDIWEYAAVLDANDSSVLTAVPLGLHYKQDTVSDQWDVTYYEDGDATFCFDENGNLIWNDLKEDAGKGLVFAKIGRFFGGRYMKGDIEVDFFEWYDDEYDVRLFQRGENGEILKDAIMKGPYDAATDTLTVTGEFENEDPMTITFSFNESNEVVWTENGESTVLELSFYTDD